jgi:hypothetical protein
MESDLWRNFEIYGVRRHQKEAIEFRAAAHQLLKTSIKT